MSHFIHFMSYFLLVSLITLGPATVFGQSPPAPCSAKIPTTIENGKLGDSFCLARQFLSDTGTDDTYNWPVRAVKADAWPTRCDVSQVMFKAKSAECRHAAHIGDKDRLRLQYDYNTGGYKFSIRDQLDRAVWVEAALTPVDRNGKILYFWATSGNIKYFLYLLDAPSGNDIYKYFMVEAFDLNDPNGACLDEMPDRTPEVISSRPSAGCNATFSPPALSPDQEELIRWLLAIDLRLKQTDVSVGYEPPP